MAVKRPSLAVAASKAGPGGNTPALLDRFLPRRLPRDARDTLFLLAVIGWTLLPHLAHLPWWTGVLAALVLAWRALLALTNQPLPGRWSLIAVLAVAVGLTLLTEHTLLGKEAGVTMLVVLMVLKTLELRARRDALVVFFLGFFLVLTNFLYSQTLLVAAAMLVSVWGLLAALVLAHMPVGRPSLREAGTLAARAALLGAPVMVALFVLFPRIGPLWGLPPDAGAHTGLSGEMRMGEMAEVANDDSIAMRVRFDGPRPPASQLYFRGPVLSDFDGETWRRHRNPRGAAPDTPLQLEGPPVRYEVTLEPSRLSMLPLLEATPDAPGSAPDIPGWTAHLGSAQQWLTDRPITERLRFKTAAWPRYREGPFTPRWSLREDLLLPEDSNPRMRAWVTGLHADPRYARAGPDTIAAMLLDHIRSGGFSYTLAPGSYGRDAVDEFWFDRRRGFCEHFASAFVVAMRDFGIPARIVTGYQGVDPAPVDGYWIVRQSYAHAWAEYWEPLRGWVRADPTAAVDPARVERSQPLAPQEGVVAGAIDAVSPGLLRQLRTMWEATNNRWNQWVLGYSQQQQFDLLKRLGVSSPSWNDLAMTLIGLLSSASLAGALWAWWDRHRQDPWQRLYGRVRRALGRLGIETQPHEPPRTLAGRIRAVMGSSGDALAAQLDALDALRYGRDARTRPPRAWWRAFALEASRCRVASTPRPQAA
jgi:transglutaminase-like putative cysteine protease